MRARVQVGLARRTKLFLFIGFWITVAFAPGCSTQRLSATTQRDLWIAGAFLAGGAIGAATTPEGDSSSAHALLGGGIAAAATAVIVNHSIDSSDSTDDVARMRRELETFQKGKSVLEQAGAGVFTDRDGQKVLSGQKADWKIYSTDRWIKDDATHLHHVDRDVEITPALSSEPSAPRSPVTVPHPATSPK